MRAVGKKAGPSKGRTRVCAMPAAPASDCPASHAALFAPTPLLEGAPAAWGAPSLGPPGGTAGGHPGDPAQVQGGERENHAQPWECRKWFSKMQDQHIQSSPGQSCPPRHRLYLQEAEQPEWNVSAALVGCPSAWG